jgi:hypothetical protein
MKLALAIFICVVLHCVAALIACLVLGFNRLREDDEQ